MEMMTYDDNVRNENVPQIHYLGIERKHNPKLVVENLLIFL